MNDLNETNGMNDLNGGKLPPAREAVIEQAQRIHQEVAHERDQLQREVWSLKNDIAGYKVALEAQASQLAHLESRVAETTVVRDEAVARRAEVETVLESMLALGRAFRIGSAPLVRAVEGQADDRENDQDAANRAGPGVTGL